MRDRSFQKKMDEVAVITSDSPLPTTTTTTMSAAESPEIAEINGSISSEEPQHQEDVETKSESKEENSPAIELTDNDNKEDAEPVKSDGHVEQDGGDDHHEENDNNNHEGEEENEDEGEEEELEGGLESGGSEEQMCRICDEKYKQPRILSCLHVFCTACLEKQLEEDAEHDTVLGAVNGLKNSIKCPICKQVTPLTDKGIDGLPLDTVMANILDMAAMDDPQIVCTSCKAKEKAVARCNDCASFLCPNCVTAHQYMRCFENHKVTPLVYCKFCSLFAWVAVVTETLIDINLHEIKEHFVLGGVVRRSAEWRRR